MKVVLISPPEQHVLVEAGDRPNMGLLYLSASLRQAGHNPVISDLNHDSYRTLKDKLEGTDFIGITTMTPYFHWFDQLSRHLKQNYPLVPLIAGGPHATVDPSSLNTFDYIVRGEGEQAIVDIVNGKVKSNTLQSLRTDPFQEIMHYPYERYLDDLPSPHSETDSVYSMNQEGHKTMTLLTSRCCNYNCFFCTKGILGKKQRFHSLDRVFEEMEFLLEKGFDSFYFLDDTFTVKRRRALYFADEILDRKWDVSFRFGTRTDKVDSKLLDKLQKAGLRSISFGLEHMDNQVLKRIQKGEKVETHLKAIRMAKEIGLKVRGSFIVNGPGATRETAERTFQYAISEGLDYADFYPLIAYPGTPLWNNPKKFDAKVDKAYGFYQTNTKTNVSFPTMSKEETSELVEHARNRWATHKGLLCPWEAK